MPDVSMLLLRCSALHIDEQTDSHDYAISVSSPPAPAPVPAHPSLLPASQSQSPPRLGSPSRARCSVIGGRNLHFKFIEFGLQELSSYLLCMCSAIGM